MLTSHRHAKLDLHLESPPQVSNRKPWKEQAEDAKVIFDKVLNGHYHGKSGYKKVACLLLTWEDDDMRCKETEASQTALTPPYPSATQLTWPGSGGRIAPNIRRRFPF